jgi:hypothetical protein
LTGADGKIYGAKNRAGTVSRRFNPEKIGSFVESAWRAERSQLY